MGGTMVTGNCGVVWCGQVRSGAEDGLGGCGVGACMHYVHTRTAGRVTYTVKCTILLFAISSLWMVLSCPWMSVIGAAEW